MKKRLLFPFLLCSSFMLAQDYGYLSGSFESNFKWYNDDVKTGPFQNAKDPFDDEHLRSNNYLKLDYSYRNWGAGIQVESYLPKPLLSYSDKYEGTNVSTFYAAYRSAKLDVRAGYFYEQFGSGLILRSWEDRQLGINNALFGGRVTYRPFNSLFVTGLYGRQKEGFDLSEGQIFGFNTELELDKLFDFQSTSLGIGFSYVGRHQDLPENIPASTTSALTNAYSFRFQFSEKKFYAKGEYIIKKPDINYVADTYQDKVVNPGGAMLLNLGYISSGFGVNATFRRLENMAFFSDRNAAGNDFNMNVVNYLPALTKQHDYLLTNVYVYQAQPNLVIIDNQSGEIGGQFDLYYNFKPETALGGKYGTKIAINASYWTGLKATYDWPAYSTDILGFGERYFSDISVEMRKQFSPSFNAIFTYVNQYYNQKIEGHKGIVYSDIAVAEANYRLNEKQSMRVVVQHLWTKNDLKNWGAATVEFNVNPKISFYVSDMYNYGNDDLYAQIHFYNLGGSFTTGPHRFALNYGRQRGGVICVGGVCRYVPPSTGLSASISILF